MMKRKQFRRRLFANLESLEARRLLTTIDLGSVFQGEDDGDRSGWSVSDAGDVNGDGIDDVIIGAYGADGANNGTNNAGESHVVFGSTSLSPTIDLANLGSNGITIYGADVFDKSGVSVSTAGDVNGDGFDDLIIGAYGADGPNNTTNVAGESYVVFGGASLPATIDLANLGTAGVTLFGVDSDDQSGKAVSTAGDVNGDGFDDLIIGAAGADGASNSTSNAGESYVVFGSTSLPASIDLANLGTAGVTIYGVNAHDYSGGSVSTAGDVNGDGFDDVIIGARSAGVTNNAKDYAGASYVVFGGNSLPATIQLSTLGTAGVTLEGAHTYDYSGESVSSAGDFNGDGFDDVVIGASYSDQNTFLGAGYIVFGQASLAGTIDLASLGAAGVAVQSSSAVNSFINAVSDAGDVNADGIDDVIFNAFDHGSYVVFGGTSLPQTVDLDNLGSDGITLLGNHRSVSSAGDVNGDGGFDLIIGNPNADNVGSNSGESYLFFGVSAPQAIINDKIGIHRGSYFYQDVNGNGVWDGAPDVIDQFGVNGDIPIIGDWNGDGIDEIGVKRGSLFYRDMNGNGIWDPTIDAVSGFGFTDDIPIIGDWNGDGIDEIGVKRDQFFFRDMDGSGTWTTGDTITSFGLVDDVPIIGDWNGDGIDEIGVKRNQFFYRDANGNSVWDAGDVVSGFGLVNDIPIIGDWNGDGIDEIGVKRNQLFYRDMNGNGAWDPAIDVVSGFGLPTDTPIIGKWRPPAPSSFAGDITHEVLAGDANSDGSVNFGDFLVLADNFGAVDAVWEDGDFNGDGVVGFDDFLLLSQAFPR